MLVISLALLVQSCAGPRTVTGLASPVQISNEMSAIPFLIATTRTRSPISEPPYSRDRSPTLGFSQLTVVVPATHRPGVVETSSASPDPNSQPINEGDAMRIEATLFSNRDDAQSVERVVAHLALDSNVQSASWKPEEKTE